MKKVIKAGLMTLMVLMVGACEVDADSPTKVAEEYCKAKIVKECRLYYNNIEYIPCDNRFENGTVKRSEVIGKDGNYATVKVFIEGIYEGKGEMELKMAKEYGVWKVDKVSSVSGYTSLFASDNFSEFKTFFEAQKKGDPKFNIEKVIDYVVKKKGPDYFKLLIENGVNPNAKNSKGYTPLHIAAKEGKKDIVEYLISQKVEINPLDNDGYTPVDWACANGEGTGYIEVAKILKKAGGKHTDAWRRATQ